MAIFYLKKLNRNNRRMYPSQIVENILAESFTFHEFDEVAVEMVKYNKKGERCNNEKDNRIN